MVVGASWLSQHSCVCGIVMIQMEIPGMDPVFMAFSLFRRYKYQECVDCCSKILEINPYDESVWSLKTRALTEQVQVDDVEADEEGIADVVLDDNTIRAVPRPGTSLRYNINCKK